MKRLKRSECAVLSLVLKRKWFDEVRLGGKREEYRAATAYWATRLLNWYDAPARHHVVEFRLGYAKDAPRVAFFGPGYIAAADCRHPEWGEPTTPHYAIILGERVELED